MPPCFRFCPLFPVNLPCTLRIPRWIFIHPFPAWRGVCRSLPGTLQHPFPLQHAPGAALAAFSHSGRGIIIIRVFRLLPMQGCRSYFSFFYYDPLFYPPAPADKYFFAKLIFPHHPVDAPESLYPLRYFQCRGFPHPIKIPAY